ncbi:peptidase C25 [Thermaurantimonas aggregans]|uniref:Peptidase C25 n=1 Tax=Thermaurantimonas aggregans TaxID=2173829 RepID=A0A401XKT9_9FLAO|nr:type IX secretion system sortase PorU [Thermaurantimonas aggregans]GCD77639.1 peptidase C25 [Thermaurantimonas aggregans]
MYVEDLMNTVRGRRWIKTLLFAFTGLAAYSQTRFTKDINIEWIFKQERFGSEITVSFPFTAEKNVFYNEQRLPYYKLSLQNSSADVDTVILTRDVWVEWKEPLIAENVLNVERSRTTSILIQKNGTSELVVTIPLFKLSNGKVFLLKSGHIELTTTSMAASAQRKRTAQFANTSVLSSGRWLKVSVDKDGIYKITPQFLSSNGVTGEIRINEIAVYGNAEGLLPETAGARKTDDLLENAVLAVDANNDGIFNGNDYILFYAKAAHRWDYNASTGTFQHVYHWYADRGVYFIRIDKPNALRITTQPEATGTQTHLCTSFDDYAFIEENKYNLLRTGRQWFGDVFDFRLSYLYSFNFPNPVPSEPYTLTVRAIARSTIPGTFMEARSGTTPVVQLNFPAVAQGDFSDRYTVVTQSGNLNPGNGAISVNLVFNNSANPGATAWLDWIRITGRRQLIMSGNQLLFRDLRTVGSGYVTRFQIQNATPGLMVWDVTHPTNYHALTGSITGNVWQSLQHTDTLREFVAFSGSNFPLPTFISQVPNQNLHAEQTADYIIITHPSFLPASNKLAEYRAQKNGYRTLVVTTEQIYNEYSSGIQDIAAIRDFLRHQYLKAPAGQGLKYVALMGTASYDYRDVLTGNTNFVPTYQSIPSFNLYTSFVTDDFFAQLDAGEGGNLMAGDLDIAIGRFTVRTPAEAMAVVNKVIHYETAQSAKGSWRSNLLWVTDDVDAAWERSFMEASEQISGDVKARYPFFNHQKVYADAYVQVSTSGTQLYPEAREDIFRSVQRGNLITNYIGHGGEVGWGYEQYLRIEDIEAWNNLDNMPLFVTITCEFTRFDEVWRVSAGEKVLTNPKGAGIALISTTRAVGAFTGMQLNELIFDTIFTKDASGYLPLGIVTKYAKNGTGSSDRLRFSYIGDPALRLPIPINNSTITQINSISTSQFSDTLRALDRVKIQAKVTGPDNQVISDFTGESEIRVFDKPVKRVTLLNDGAGLPFEFETQTALIYSGRASVTNGLYTAEFIIPKDINLSFGKGRFSLYAFNQEVEAIGYNDQVTVGGLNENAPEDRVGPQISIFLNDENFVMGGITGPNPLLIVKLADSSGINALGNSIGRDIVAILNGREDQPIVLNEYYKADLNTFKSGVVRYPLFNLKEGNYTLAVRAWDTYNNPNTAYSEFIVTSSSEFVIRHLLNYPNPFTTSTKFQFEHNRPNHPLEVTIQIFTVSGRLVKTIHQFVQSPGSRVTDIHWDGLDDFGNKIGKGVYIYRLKVRSALDDSKAEQYEKLVLLR